MAHNPIVERYVSGVFDKFIITENQVGLLYKNHRFERKLRPGESPTINEKFAGKLMGQEIAVYVVDLKPHALDWRINLPAQHKEDFFPVEIRMSYRVSKPERMVDNDVKDTEQEVTRFLEKELGRVSRNFPLNQHIQVDNALTDWINNQDNLQEYCGVERVSPADVQIRLSQEQEKRAKRLNELDIRMRTPQTYEFTGQVPSQDVPLNFEVQVQMEYRVSNRENLPSSDLDEVAASLKPRILAALKRVSRQYGIAQLVQADEGLQDKLDVSLKDFDRAGLEVDSVFVSCDLNPEARGRYLEKLGVMHNAEMEELTMRGVKKTADVVYELIEKGNFAVLAMAVARKEIPMIGLNERMNEQQQKQFEMQMQVLEKFTDSKLINEGPMYARISEVAKNLAVSATGIPTVDNPQLGTGPKKTQPGGAAEPKESD